MRAPLLSYWYLFLNKCNVYRYAIREFQLVCQVCQVDAVVMETRSY